MAETYGVFDYQALPVRTAAALFWGLRDDARIKRLMAKTPVGVDTLLRAAIADRLSLLVWFQTRDGRAGRNRPASFMAQLMNKQPDTPVRAFSSGEAFEAARRRILEEARNGGQDQG